MKKLLYILVVLALATISTLSSCVRSDTIEPKADLEINVKDAQDNVQQNAEVRIYASLEDWISRTNQVGDTKLTDSGGKVLFTDLESKKYYWLVEKSCLNNVFGFSTTRNAIEEGKKSIVATVIEGTGTLEIVNSSNDIYVVYIDGEIADSSMDGGLTRSFIAKEGALIVRVVQQTGITTAPIDETYPITIECGETTTVSFP